MAAAALFGAGSAAAKPFEAERGELQANAPADNDLHLSGDWRAKGPRVAVPGAVARSVRAAAAQMVDRLGLPDDAAATCADVFSPLSRLPGPGGLQLFVAEVRLPTAPGWFLLVLYDPATGRATQAPARIGARWAQAGDPLMKRPLVWTSARFGAGRPQIVFEERVHNGTLYNGVVHHYFDVGPDLAPTRALAVEPRVLEAGGRGVLYLRTVERLGPDRLRLDLFRQDASGRREAQSYAILQREGPGRPFRVGERKPRPGIDPAGLVTFCGNVEDDEFLQRGCDFYY